MKKITLTLVCLAAVTMSVVAQEQPAADNSAKNQRDRSGETLTSVDQSNSPEDTKLTAAIRRAVVADKSLSATAKNVKIITVNGVVTLRGPVKTDAEKATVEKLAQSAAGGARIDNQLEVKASE
jgi:hyperosmotically inducible protein